MTNTLFMGIRGHFRRYIEDGWTARAAGRALKISPVSVERFRQTILQGKSFEAKPRGGHRDIGKLAGFGNFLIEMVSQDPQRRQPDIRRPFEKK